MIKKLLWEYIKQNKIKSILCILALVVSILLSLTPAQLIRIITDDYLDRNNMAVLVILICAYVLSYVLYGLSNFILSLKPWFAQVTWQMVSCDIITLGQQ